MPPVRMGEPLLGVAGMSDDNIIHFNPWRDFNDAAPQQDAFGIEPDRDQIATFLDVVFGYCEGFIPVRGFVDKGQGFDGKPHNNVSALNILGSVNIGAFIEGSSQSNAQMTYSAITGKANVHGLQYNAISNGVVYALAAGQVTSRATAPA